MNRTTRGNSSPIGDTTTLFAAADVAGGKLIGEASSALAGGVPQLPKGSGVREVETTGRGPASPLGPGHLPHSLTKHSA
jgi:hypothetical protein